MSVLHILRCYSTSFDHVTSRSFLLNILHCPFLFLSPPSQFSPHLYSSSLPRLLPLCFSFIAPLPKHIHRTHTLTLTFTLPPSPRPLKTRSLSLSFSLLLSLTLTNPPSLSLSLSLSQYQQQYLSVIIVLVFLLVLPFIFDFLARNYEGMKLESEIQNSIMTRYFYYQVLYRLGDC